MAKVTFGKFEGPLSDENPKVIYVDGVDRGYIDRLIVWEQPGTSRAWKGTVVGYSVVADSGDDALNELLVGKEWKTLGEVTQAVREAFGVHS